MGDWAVRASLLSQCLPLYPAEAIATIKNQNTRRNSRQCALTFDRNTELKIMQQDDDIAPE